mmetsp:Transcript_23598/g.53231  ORF Transcript_23598/g.53231 Transcript_23598/m.53231 type:complete len:210 (+) Transcript_23598:867-1496(+)
MPPLDAATIPGSSTIQFVARDASKPGRPATRPLPAEAAPPAAAPATGRGDGSQPAEEGELWTAVSTSALAAQVLAATTDRPTAEAAAAKIMAKELACLLANAATMAREAATDPAAGGGGGQSVQREPVVPLALRAKRWGAAFLGGGLGLKEDSVVLGPWRLAIAGEFVAQGGPPPDAKCGDWRGYPSPAEAAALSGLDAGERTAVLFQA